MSAPEGTESADVQSAGEVARTHTPTPAGEAPRAGTTTRTDAAAPADPPAQPSADDGRADARTILALALPALGALVAEPLFLTADSAIVGHLGASPLAGLGTAAAALNTLVNICIFLAYGTTAQVARLLGAGDTRTALRRGMDGIYLAAGLGVLLAVLGSGLAGPIAHALGATAEALPYATTYLRVSCLGLPAMLAVLAATGLLRGLQDTRTPLVVAATAAVVNTLLNWVLVYPVGMGIAGSALGTVLVQCAMAGVYIGAVVRAARAQQVGLRPRPGAIRTALGANTALFIRTAALRVYLLAAVWTAGSFGTAALAAHAIASNLWGTLALALDALAIAAQALVGRDLGAGNTARVRATVRRMVRWGLGFGVVTGVLLFALRPAYAPLFSNSPAVREQLAPVVAVAALFQPIAGAVFVLDGVLIGAGDATYLAWASLICTLGFLGGLGVQHALTTPGAAAQHGWASPLTVLWLIIGLYTALRWLTLAWRTRSDAWMRTGADL